jgi:deoxyribodipyrimidine photolyase-related protein
MTILRVILPDQLSLNISSLEGCNKDKDLILLCELMEDLTNVSHHKKKIVFILSAMRHFADLLRQNNYNLKYLELEEENNSGYLIEEVRKFVSDHSISKIIITHPGDYRVLSNILSWKKEFSIDVEIRDDNKFLATNLEFQHWAQDKKNLRMEFFYRQMRKKYNILMYNNQPIGMKWNYDAENRHFPNEKLSIPKRYISELDEQSKGVIKLVERKFTNNFGDIYPFNYSVTRQDALQELQKFINERLEKFGLYQDAMIQGEPWMYHSHISLYINIGLLCPMECIKEAEQAYHDNKAPLNSVEGFIRQILGWREYIKGVYWLKMPEYKELNYLEATNKLPEFYWNANTKMNCIKQCVTETKVNSYAHHIQRLMVLGNFALLTGVDPKELNEWFLIVYIDAYEWVELPNVSGMVLFADGGFLASKPYAAGGSYINKMSNYCKNCAYNVAKKNGSNACPFNYLYWNFLIKNYSKLSSNQRLQMIYQTYHKMSAEKKELIKNDSLQFLKNITDGVVV